jgi:hypothetical protein
LLCAHPAVDAQAKDRAKVLAISGAISWGLISPDDVNRQIQFDNLSFAVALEDMTTFTEVVGELRYGISNRVSAEAQIGFLWQDVNDGRVSRRLSTFPLTLSLVYFLVAGESRTLSAIAGGGVLLETRLSGEDPLGQSHFSGTGYVAQAALEFEQMFSDLWAIRLRALGQLAKATDVLPDGGMIDLSGGALQLGLRAYFK